MPQLAQEFEYQYFVPYYSLLCAYKFLCYLVQQVRRRHPKKTASRMEELQVILLMRLLKSVRAGLA